MWLFLAFNGGKEKTTKKTNMIKCISFLYVFCCVENYFQHVFLKFLY